MWQEKLKEKMEEVGMTETQLAELCGISQPAVSSYIKGTRRPTALTRKKIKEAIGYDIDKEMAKEIRLKLKG